MHIHASSENYLEAILALSEKGPVRSIDVAQYLSFSKPSVSRAMSLLRENGYRYRGNILVESERGHDPHRQAFEKILKDKK